MIVGYPLKVGHPLKLKSRGNPCGCPIVDLSHKHKGRRKACPYNHHRPGLSGYPFSEDSAEKQYQKALYKELTGLIDSPETPVIAPSKVMRVMILPYKNGNTLYMNRYVYFIADEPAWVLGDYLIEDAE